MDLDRSFAGCGPYLVDLPYPAVAVANPNPHYARIISDAYAGRGSETTAIRGMCRTGHTEPSPPPARRRTVSQWRRW